MTEALIDKTMDVLARQRRALLDGDLADLDRLAPLLERALSRLAQSRPPAAQLTRLRDAAARNAAMIAAAQRGMTQAISMLRPATGVELTTYGPKGARAPVTPARGNTLSRR